VSLDPSVELALLVAAAADEKSASDVVILDVGPVLGICDLFVVATAANERQVRAVVDHVEARVAERFDRRPLAVEGADARRWVLIDYGEVVVHVFQQEERSTYRLERLYGDAPRVAWEPAVSPPEPAG
jgi:ribosome-associated protein